MAWLTTRLVTRNKRFHRDRSGWNMNRAVREATGQRYRSPPTTEPAAYLARWPVIFEGSVTGLPSPRHEVPRVPASRDSLCINDKVYRFLSRSGSGWTGAGRTRRRVKIESFNGTRVQRANIECWGVELQHSEDTR